MMLVWLKTAGENKAPRSYKVSREGLFLYMQKLSFFRPFQQEKASA